MNPPTTKSSQLATKFADAVALPLTWRAWTNLSWQNRTGKNRTGSMPIHSSNSIHYASCQAPFRNNRFTKKSLTFHGTVANGILLPSEPPFDRLPYHMDVLTDHGLFHDWLAGTPIAWLLQSQKVLPQRSKFSCGSRGTCDNRMSRVYFPYRMLHSPLLAMMVLGNGRPGVLGTLEPFRCKPMNNDEPFQAKQGESPLHNSTSIADALSVDPGARKDMKVRCSVENGSSAGTINVAFVVWYRYTWLFGESSEHSRFFRFSIIPYYSWWIDSKNGSVGSNEETAGGKNAATVALMSSDWYIPGNFILVVIVMLQILRNATVQLGLLSRLYLIQRTDQANKEHCKICVGTAAAKATSNVSV
jgi:hypothetical protein